MKYKTLVMKQIDQHTYQYSMNAPLDHLSPGSLTPLFTIDLKHSA